MRLLACDLCASALCSGFSLVYRIVPLVFNLVLELEVLPLAVEVLHPLTGALRLVAGLRLCAATRILGVAIEAFPVAIPGVPTLLALLLVREGHRGSPGAALMYRSSQGRP